MGEGWTGRGISDACACHASQLPAHHCHTVHLSRLLHQGRRAADDDYSKHSFYFTAAPQSDYRLALRSQQAGIITPKILLHCALFSRQIVPPQPHLCCSCPIIPLPTRGRRMIKYEYRRAHFALALRLLSIANTRRGKKSGKKEKETIKTKKSHPSRAHRDKTKTLIRQ